MDVESLEKSPSDPLDLLNYQLTKDREMRPIYLPLMYDNLDLVAYVLSFDMNIDDTKLKTYVVIMYCSNSDKWYNEMCEK